MQATPVERPRFRQDLVAEPIEDGGARFIDVLDPDSGTLFRFFEVEYSLACAMDGQRDVAGIVKWADEELGLKTSAKEVGFVISTLGDLGYLESGAAAAAAATAPAAAAAAAKPAKTPTPATEIKKQPEQPAVNRWDQPTQMGDADDYLQKGVVHGGARAATPAPDVELGKPGTRPAQAESLPRAPELELGAPGAAAAAGARPAAGKVDDIPLGKPGKTENVETDLAADMPLSPAAVKEAVRQSQVMKAVDVPPELAAEMNKPAAKVEAKPAKAEPKVEAKPAAEAKVEAKPAEKAAQKPAEKAAQKPAEKAAQKPAEKAAQKPAEKAAQKPAEKAAQKPAEPAPPPAARGPSPVLIAALVLAILGVGGFAVWKFVLAKKETAQSTGQAPPTPPPQPEPPAPPPVETAKLATEQPAAEEVKPVAAGQVATIVANDTAVKEGDPIARLVGFKPVEAQVTAADKALAKAKDVVAAAEKERDAAQTAGNKNGVTSAEKKLTSAQKNITEQEGKLANAKAALDKFLIKAPAAGKVNAVAKANAKVTPTDVIATLTRDPVLVATFKSAGEVAVGSRVLLGLAGSEQKLSCTVAQAGGDGVKIACPKDAASEGAEVTYAGIDPNAPPTGETSPSEAGSAAGSAVAPPEAPKPEEITPEEPKPEDAKPEEKKAEEKKAERKRRPRPRPPVEKPAGGDKPAGSGDPAAAGSDKPADKPADPPPAPAPAPAGSGTP